MKVRINGSTDVHHFSLFDESLGDDKIVEFLETHCAFVADKFIYQADEDVYICDDDVFETWQQIIEDQQLLNARINELKVEHGDLWVDEIVNKAYFHGIEDEAAAINYELDRALGEE